MSARGHGDRSSTDRLLQALVEDAGPIEPIHSMGRVAAGLCAIFGVWWIASVWLLGGVRDAASLVDVVTDGFFLGLVSSIVGATGAVLAAREPGRETAARGAVTLAGVGVAVILTTFAMRVADGAAGSSLGADLHCALASACVGSVPAVMLLGVALGGWRGRPLVSSIAAATGGVALGAVAVHVTCPAQGAWHVLLGHCVLPLMAASAAGALGAFGWLRLARR
jgi:hypothetical protein